MNLLAHLHLSDGLPAGVAAGNLLAPGQVISINLPPLTPGQAPAGIKLARQYFCPAGCARLDGWR